MGSFLVEAERNSVFSQAASFLGAIYVPHNFLKVGKDFGAGTNSGKICRSSPGQGGVAAAMFH